MPLGPFTVYRDADHPEGVQAAADLVWSRVHLRWYWILEIRHTYAVTRLQWSQWRSSTPPRVSTERVDGGWPRHPGDGVHIPEGPGG